MHKIERKKIGSRKENVWQTEKRISHFLKLFKHYKLNSQFDLQCIIIL